MRFRGVLAFPVLALGSLHSNAYSYSPSDGDAGEIDLRTTELTRPAPVFSENAPEGVVLAVKQAIDRKFGPSGLKYSTSQSYASSPGVNISLTWSFVPDGVIIPFGIGDPPAPSNLFSSMNQHFGNDQALWISEVQSCFDRWEAVSGIDFTRVTAPGVEWDDGAMFNMAGNDTTRGDIRIGSKVILPDVLGYGTMPNQGEIVINSDTLWNAPSPDGVNLRVVLFYTIGVSMGLYPSCPANGTKVMESYYSPLNNDVKQDDIRGIQALYGDAHEPDDVAQEAFDIGNLSSGSELFGPPPSPAISNAAIYSIDRDSEEDWWKFTVSAPADLSIDLTPVGSTYVVGSTATCNNQASVNALAMADLAFDVRTDPHGQTILASVDGALAGFSESVIGLDLPSAGTYYIRVYEKNQPTQSQLYQLRVEVGPICAGSVAPGGAGCAGSGGCVPAIAMTGCPQSNQNFTYSVSNGVGGQLAILLLGLAPGSVATSNGCVLQLGAMLPSTVPLPLNGSGSCAGSNSVGAILPTLSSATLYFQAAFADPGSVGGYTLSNSLAVTFAP